MNAAIPLSKLVAGRHNPRRVKPERETHRRLVASVRAYGLLEPLIVQPLEDDRYRVIAGNRRLAALRAVHADGDEKVPCIVKRVDGDTATAMSLAENFAREPMHPLDEAETFAHLASSDRKGVAVIAEEFGVSETYVRQRMKLSSLAEPIKAAFRSDLITVGTAEAFAAVPPLRQLEIWDETGGKPRTAQQVRSIIENAWVQGDHALFDVAGLDPNAVSHDLFGGRVLVERQAFLKAQGEALLIEERKLSEDGWKEVVIGESTEVQERLYTMDEAEPDYDAATTKALRRLRAKREKLEGVEDEESQRKSEADLEALDEEERGSSTPRRGPSERRPRPRARSFSSSPRMGR